MTELELICPIMSRPNADYVYCLREKCAAWETTSAACNGEEDCEQCIDEYVPDCSNYIVEEGFCKLIERGE